MCIVAIAWQVFDELPLVLLSNRDEFLDRPTLPAHQWRDMPVFAGRDETSGGTWLGYGTDNKEKKVHNTRWATVLNFRDGVLATTAQLSRGQLITDFLTSDLSPMAFAKQLNLTDYVGFNLIVGDEKQAVLLNNRGYPPTALHTGLHVISNGQPEDEWYKCERLRTRVYQEVLPIISQDISQKAVKSEWQKIAFDVLSDTEQAPDNKLPNTSIARHVEQALSSVCIEQGRLKNYGTRTQSILTLDSKNWGNKNENSEKESHKKGFNLMTKAFV